MEDNHQAYEVEMYDDATRWLCTRRQTGDGYLVELDSINGHHKCGCKHGQFQKKWSKVYCRHIKAVIAKIMEGEDPEGL